MGGTKDGDKGGGGRREGGEGERAKQEHVESRRGCEEEKEESALSLSLIIFITIFVISCSRIFIVLMIVTHSYQRYH